ncbi:MAG: hypothetical protein QOG59_2435 [Solirubrobacteraceae bacterium]|nr:hypothetical protein [Solirubrobacteraceae bacterium]
MTEATQQRRGNGLSRATKRLRRQPPSTSQTGAALFPHVVWAHYQWERRLHADNIADAALEQAYQSKLADFQREQGKIEQVYWSTRTASAVAMTVKLGPVPRGNPLHLRERDNVVRFHRVTDWVTRDAPLVADLLHECDLLASRVEQVLRGTSQRIAMRWILGIAMHLLGFLERDSAAADRRSEERAFVQAQRLKLTEAEAYYHRAASQAGRVIYVSGMFVGVLFIAVLGGLAAWLLGTSDMSSAHRKLALLCYGAGAIGALVSTMSRMGKPEAGKFNIDFELGRPLIRRLGIFRPLVGGVFGVALFFLLASGLLDLKPGSGAEPYYYGFAAFLAGFSERFATGMLAGAEHRLVPTGPADPGRPVAPGDASAQELV